MAVAVKIYFLFSKPLQQNELPIGPRLAHIRCWTYHAGVIKIIGCDRSRPPGKSDDAAGGITRDVGALWVILSMP